MRELSPRVLRGIVERVVESLRPREIYLFGSQASGSPDEDSDVDLLVVVDERSPDTRELARKGRRSLWGVGLPVDLIVCTSEEMKTWSGVACNLLHTVAKEGRRIYAAGEATGNPVALEGR